MSNQSNPNVSIANINPQITKMVIVEPSSLIRESENIAVLNNEAIVMEGNKEHQVAVLSGEMVVGDPVEYIETNQLTTNPENQYIITNTPNSTLNGNIQYIPSDGFLQLTPNSAYQNQPTKLYTEILSADGSYVNPNICHVRGLNIVSNVSKENSAQQHIFTLKSPNGEITQFSTTKSITINSDPTCVVPIEVQSKISENESMEVTDDSANSETCIELNNSTTSNEMDISNIIDMPIVFADKDGNLTDSIINDRNDIIEYSSDEQIINNTTTTNNEDKDGNI